MTRGRLYWCVQILVSTTALLLLPVEGFAARFSLVGGALSSAPQDEAGSFIADVGYLGGAGWMIPLFKRAQVDVEALYFQRRFHTVSKSPRIQFVNTGVQGGVTFWAPLTNRWSLGVGGYVAVPIGKIRYKYDGTSGTAQYARRYDVGATVGVRMGGQGSGRMFLECDYTRGIVGVSAANEAAKYESLQLRLGIVIGRNKARK